MTKFERFSKRISPVNIAFLVDSCSHAHILFFASMQQFQSEQCSAAPDSKIFEIAKWRTSSQVQLTG